MTETSSVVVEDMLAPNPPSPAPTDPANTTLTVNGVNGHPVDPDGDVTMEQPSPIVNGSMDRDREASHPDSTAPPLPSASASPYHPEPDDDLKPPPAKRPRKHSDADRASLANVSMFPYTSYVFFF